MYTYEFPKADNTSSIICYHLHPGEHSGKDKLTFVAIRRGREPFKGKMALPGGFLDVAVRSEDMVATRPGETLERCAQRELEEETGVSAPLEDFILVCVQSKPERDPRNHVIDHVYCVEVPAEKIESAKADDDAAELVLLQLERETIASSSWQDGGWAFDHADSFRRFLKDHIGWL